ncbi:MAG: DUF2950 domain-containing protein [Thermoanaerobaculia bacterium]
MSLFWARTAPAGGNPEQKEAPKQTLYSTPEEAVKALVSATEAKDQAAMMAIFGPERERLLSGDPVEDQNALERFAERLRKSSELEKVSDTKFTVLVGEDKFPFPIPLIQESGTWHFDTPAGIDEILSRKIGRNELSAIMTCRAYVVAQWEYFTQPLDTSEDGLAVYAQRFISTPGKRDGLYWDTPEGAPLSPLGSLIMQERAEGYPAGRARSTEAAGKDSAAPVRKRSPYHGYYFRILKSQGAHAPGGKFGYVINGHMIAGYALVAYPSKWGSSGVMTFLVNQQGRVYEKNLGPATEQLASAMTEYDPDPTWKLAKEE